MLGLALKHFEYGFVVERQADAQLALVFVKRLLVPVGKDGAVLDDRLVVVRRHSFYGDY